MHFIPKPICSCLAVECSSHIVVLHVATITFERLLGYLPLWLARTITTPEANTGQWVILVTVEAESSEGTMTGTIFLFWAGLRAGNQAVQEADLPERVRTNTQAVLRLGWGGMAKGNQAVQQAEASQKSFGRGLQELGAWAPRHLGPGHQSGLVLDPKRGGGPGGKRARHTPPPPPFLGGKRRKFSFSPLKPSNTSPKVGGNPKP